jgi:hypothetical protein
MQRPRAPGRAFVVETRRWWGCGCEPSHRGPRSAQYRVILGLAASLRCSTLAAQDITGAWHPPSEARLRDRPASQSRRGCFGRRAARPCGSARYRGSRTPRRHGHRAPGCRPTITAWAAQTPSAAGACLKIAGLGLDVPTSPEMTTASKPASARAHPASFSRWRHDAPFVTTASRCVLRSSSRAGWVSGNASCRSRRSSPNRRPSSSARAESATPWSARAMIHASVRYPAAHSRQRRTSALSPSQRHHSASQELIPIVSSPYA